MSDNKYDVIIIGSGIGGMTAANLLAKIGKKKVLVLEQHWEPGGLTHEFKRKGKFHWDVGIHYVGKLQPGSLDTQVLDFISEGEIKWNDMPYMYDVFHYPGLDFSVPSDKDDYKK